MLYALRMHISLSPQPGLRRDRRRGLAGAGCGSGDCQPPRSPRAPRSAGAPWSSCPRVVGRRQDDAHRIVERAGLKLRWTGFIGKLGNGRYNVSCVKVLSQSPVAGERRPRGASVAVIEAACHTPDQAPYAAFTPGRSETGPAHGL